MKIKALLRFETLRGPDVCLIAWVRIVEKESDMRRKLLIVKLIDMFVPRLVSSCPFFLLLRLIFS